MPHDERNEGEPNLLREKSGNPLSRRLSQPLFDDPKAKKRALVEAELQDAISVLRKPNRELAGKAVVEAAERRAASASLSQMRSTSSSCSSFLSFFFYFLGGVRFSFDSH